MISINREVENVVSELTRNSRLFTAYDVTRILRHRFDGEKIFHKEIKRAVHAVYDGDQMGIYSRSQIRVGAGQPFVYHLNQNDPSTDYNDAWVNAFLQLQASLSNPIDPITGQPVTPSVTPSAPVTVNSTKVASRTQALSNGGKTVKVTKEGRLNIPVDMLEGFSDTAYLSLTIARQGKFNVDAISITATKPMVALKAYGINSDGRLRVSKKFLDLISKDSSFTIKDLSQQLGHSVIVIVPE
jgi:hypothetical protein